MLTKEQIIKVQKTVEESIEDERVPFALRALSDFGRFKIFKLLAARKEDMCVTDIANIFNISVPAASQQLHVLEMTGIVKKERMGQIKGLKNHAEFVHFALTSEDVNNLAYGILIHEALKTVIRPALRSLIADLDRLSKKTSKIALLSLTHGQAATPTVLGKEIGVFVDRLRRQDAYLKAFRMQGKFGGAVGTYGAHRAAYPDVPWEKVGGNSSEVSGSIRSHARRRSILTTISRN